MSTAKSIATNLAVIADAGYALWMNEPSFFYLRWCHSKGSDTTDRRRREKQGERVAKVVRKATKNVVW